MSAAPTSSTPALPLIKAVWRVNNASTCCRTSASFSALLSPGKPFYTRFRMLDSTGRLLAGAPDCGLWTIDYRGERVQRLAEGKPFVSTGSSYGAGPASPHPVVELLPFACVFSPNESWQASASFPVVSLQLKRMDLSGAPPSVEERP